MNQIHEMRLCKDCKHEHISPDLLPCDGCLYSDNPHKPNWEPKPEPIKEKTPMDDKFPSIEVHEALTGAYEYLNAELFDGELQMCYVTLTRNPRIRAGHFFPNSWEDKDGNKWHEIALNANVYGENGGDWLYAMAVLVHEMKHLQKYDNGTHGKLSYHSKEYVAELKELGVLSKGPDGEIIECGEQAVAEFIPGSRLETALLEMPEEYVVMYIPTALNDPTQVVVIERNPGQREPAPPVKAGVKIKYTCPECGNNAWGKGGMELYCAGTQDFHPLKEMVAQVS